MLGGGSGTASGAGEEVAGVLPGLAGRELKPEVCSLEDWERVETGMLPGVDTACSEALEPALVALLIPPVGVVILNGRDIGTKQYELEKRNGCENRNLIER